MLRILPWILLTLSVGVLLGVSGYGGYTLGDSDGYHRGYTQGSIDGAGSGYNLRNPTYAEVTDFMARDRTDENEYEEGVYTCSDFASDFNNNAEAEGYRCGFVYMEYGGNFGHSIAAFDTVDQGMVFIESQFDEVVTVSVGTSYSQANGFKQPDYEDTIKRYTVAW